MAACPVPLCQLPDNVRATGPLILACISSHWQSKRRRRRRRGRAKAAATTNKRKGECALFLSLVCGVCVLSCWLFMCVRTERGCVPSVSLRGGLRKGPGPWPAGGSPRGLPGNGAETEGPLTAHCRERPRSHEGGHRCLL